MSDWMKIGLTVCGFAIVTWASVQQHEYRIDKLEHSFDAHLQKHDDQYREIQQTMREVEIALTRMSATKGN